MQKGVGEGVQIACKIAYVINGRPHTPFFFSRDRLLTPPWVCFELTVQSMTTADIFTGFPYHDMTIPYTRLFSLSYLNLFFFNTRLSILEL